MPTTPYAGSRGRVPHTSAGVEIDHPTAAGQTANGVLLGAVNETAPASDTASSGLNGRLQRASQRITSLIALIPTALGANGGLKTAIPGSKLTITPVVETSALDAGDVVFDATAMANTVTYSGGFAILQDIVVVDLADQKAQLRLVFLQSNVSLGTLDAAPDIDDTEVLEVLGTFEVLAADYVDLGTSSVATYRSVGLMLQPTTGTSVWVAAFTSGTPTYASASALRLRFGLVQG